MSAQPQLAVWCGPMFDPTGKEKWIAVLHRKRIGRLNSIPEGICLSLSEYPDKVRYDADCARFMIGERASYPRITDYDTEKLCKLDLNESASNDTDSRSNKEAHHCIEQLVSALELAQGFLRNKGYSEDDPFVLGAINTALSDYEKVITDAK